MKPKAATSSGDVFSQLAVEILQQILGYLYVADIKNARLACQKLRDAGQQPLFKEINLYKNNWIFFSYRHVAAEDMRKKHVQCLTFNGTHLNYPAVMPFRQFIERLSLYSHDAEVRSLLEDTEMNQRSVYAKLVKAVDSSKSFRNTDTLAANFLELASTCPGIKKFIYYDSPILHYLPPALRGMCSHQVASPVTSHRATAARQRSHLLTLLMALEQMPERLKALQCLELCNIKWHIVELDTDQSLLSRLQKSLNGLKEIYQSFNTFFTGSQDGLSQPRLYWLKQLILASQKVGSLHLSLSHFFPGCMGTWDNFNYIFSMGCSSQRLVFSNLRQLTLKGIITHQGVLERFLREQGSHLRELHFGYSYLYRTVAFTADRPQASWLQLLEFMKSTLTLTDCSFSGTLRTDGYENWVIGNENPFFEDIPDARGGVSLYSSGCLQARFRGYVVKKDILMTLCSVH